MVSKARDDLPDPETPLTTVSLPCGISQEMPFKLWVRAPRITIASFDEVNGKTPEETLGLRPDFTGKLRAQTSNFYYRRVGKRGWCASKAEGRRGRKACCSGHGTPLRARRVYVGKEEPSFAVLGGECGLMGS